MQHNLRQIIVGQPCCCLHCYSQYWASIAHVKNARKLAVATFQARQKLQHIQAIFILPPMTAYTYTSLTVQ